MSSFENRLPPENLPLPLTGGPIGQIKSHQKPSKNLRSHKTFQKKPTERTTAIFRGVTAVYFSLLRMFFSPWCFLPARRTHPLPVPPANPVAPRFVPFLPVASHPHLASHPNLPDPFELLPPYLLPVSVTAATYPPLPRTSHLRREGRMGGGIGHHSGDGACTRGEDGRRWGKGHYRAP
jgi:hypothetical protein